MKSVATIACFLLTASLAHAATEEKKEYKWEFPVQGISALAIKGVVGTIKVDTDRKNEIQIRAIRTVRAKDKNTTQLTLKDTAPTCLNEGGTLVLEDIVPEHLRRERFIEDAPEVELEIEVHIPVGLRLSSSLLVGQTAVTGELNALTIKSGSGLVKLENLKVLKGGTMIGMDTGDLELSGAFNDLQATLRVGSVRAILETNTANRIALQTQVGSILAQLKSAPKQSLSASASVGNVQIRVPGNTKGDATVSAQTGKLRSDFNLTRRPRSVGDTGGLLTGTLGRGGTVQVKVTSGVGDALLEKG
jgi:Putative adhesin